MISSRNVGIRNPTLRKNPRVYLKGSFTRSDKSYKIPKEKIGM